MDRHGCSAHSTADTRLAEVMLNMSVFSTFLLSASSTPAQRARRACVQAVRQAQFDARIAPHTQHCGAQPRSSRTLNCVTTLAQKDTHCAAHGARQRLAWIRVICHPAGGSAVFLLQLARAFFDPAHDGGRLTRVVTLCSTGGQGRRKV